MATKSLILLFVAGFLLQQNASALSLPSLTSLIEDTLKTTSGDILAIAGNARLQAQNLIDEIMRVAKTLDSMAVQTANRSANAVRAVFENTANSISATSKAAAACTQASQGDINLLATQTTKNVTGCVTEKVDRAYNSVTGIMSNAANLTAMLASMPEHINAACPSDGFLDANRIYCSLGVIKVSSEYLGDCATKLAKNVKEATELVASLSNIQTELPLCAAARTAEATVMSVPIALNIADCTLKSVQNST